MPAASSPKEHSPKDDGASVDVLIIGAGASGLFCAQALAKKAAEAGVPLRILVIDHANKAGKKILMSGGGRCNFTNLDMDSAYFLGQNRHFCKSALSVFSNWDFIDWVNAQRIAYVERDNGKLFCAHSAKDLLNALLSECAKYGVEIRLNCAVEDIQAADGFLAQAKDTRTQKPMAFAARALVVATGGLSVPTMGASAFAYRLAERFGHKVTPLVAALAPFTLTDKVGERCKALAGVALPVVAFNDKASFALPMLFTHRGLSGPAMLQLSSYWQEGEKIYVNFLPDVDLPAFLQKSKAERKKRALKTVFLEDLPTPLPKKVALFLLDELAADVANAPLTNIKDARLIQFGKDVAAYAFLPAGTEGWRTAEVTKGGVCTDEISSKSMQSLRVDNLYFIGEALDVTGHLGGYNFQWAWSSAYVCAADLFKKTAHRQNADASSCALPRRKNGCKKRQNVAK